MAGGALEVRPGCGFSCGGNQLQFREHLATLAGEFSAGALAAPRGGLSSLMVRATQRAVKITASAFLRRLMPCPRLSPQVLGPLRGPPPPEGLGLSTEEAAQGA